MGGKLAMKLFDWRLVQYSFEAANARHEHEWKVWKDVSLPEGKKILPGVVGHSTNVVEHPDLVAERIVHRAHGPDTDEDERKGPEQQGRDIGQAVRLQQGVVPVVAVIVL